MVTTAYDQCDPTGNSHACDLSFIRQIHGDPQAVRGRKRNGIFHRAGRNTTFSGKDRSVCHKGSQIPSSKFLADIVLIQCGVDPGEKLLFILTGIEIGFFYTYREKIKKNFLKFCGIDRTSVGRKTNEETGGNAFFINLTGGSGQDFLTTAAH